MLEIRLHGRGGMGAKTAGQLIAETSLYEGKHVQAFPEYGAARQGAPVQVFVRINKKRIKLYTLIESPNVIIILDPSLLKYDYIYKGIKKDTILIINYPKNKKPKLLKKPSKIYLVDATSIALDTLGKPITNSPMLGAFIKTTNIIKLKDAKKFLEQHFTEKLGKEIADKNLKALEQGYKKVR